MNIDDVYNMPEYLDEEKKEKLKREYDENLLKFCGIKKENQGITYEHSICKPKAEQKIRRLQKAVPLFL